MSKYTTEVRYICERESGLNESVGFNSVDDVISKSWDKIFTTKTPFFEEAYRKTLCCKILKHYYLREIGCETVGIWKLWVNTKLEEIMPYYNQLYESAKIKFEPLKDTDYTREGNKNGKENKAENRTSDRTLTNEEIIDSTSKNLFSDTPQGALTGVDSETYLTDARKITNNGRNNVNSRDKLTDNNTENNTSEDKYSEHVTGKMGSANYSKLLLDYRNTFLNIDMQVISEFKDLFFNLW